MNVTEQTKPRIAVIIGAGPAGLTAALELLLRTDVVPIVLEASDAVGGLSRTVEYKGNRLDIGGHRFFSKCDRVTDWWLARMPLAESERDADADGPAMLLRERHSRIYFLRQFFAYPLQLSVDTLRRLGARRTVRIVTSYLRTRLRPARPEHSLEDFLINRFGRELYATFFQSYTEKVWGVPCAEIGAAWGAQRIRSLSLTRAVRHWLKQCVRGAAADLRQRGTETSLVERFLYPRLGPGQMWDEVAREVLARGGSIHHGWLVERICVAGDRVLSVEAIMADGSGQSFQAEFVLSTMPVPALVRALSEPAPAGVRAVSDGLAFRDFLTVGILAKGLCVTQPDGSPLRDNWIYVQEPGVRMCRLQLFHNWSPAMVARPGMVWLGLEYVCNEGDDLWRMSDEALRDFAVDELAQMGLLKREDVLDACVVRAPKAYPAYFGTYDRLGEVQTYLSRFANLFPIGRNGMHRYNNQDHSMLTAMLAVDQIATGKRDAAALWSVNTEQAYHEAR